MLDSSDSVFTPPKKRRDVTCVGGRRQRKVRAQIDEKVTCTPKDSRRLAMKNSAELEDKHPSAINEVAVIGIEDKQKDESAEKFQESTVASPKAVKLAPLFLQEKTKRQNKVDQAVIEARKNFLMSGVPDAVQKMINIQRSFEEQICDIFPEVGHVQQKDDSDYIWNLPHDDSLVLKPEPAVDPGPTESSKLLKLGMFTNTEPVQVNVEKQSPPPPITAFRKILREMKREFPDFPIYRMFRALRSKFLNGSVAPSRAEVSGQSTRKTKRRGRNAKSSKQDSAATPSLSQAHVVWAEKYRPLCVDDMFSNLASVRQLKTWLESWKKFVAEMNAAETATNLDGSGEESFIGDDENSGSEHSAMPSNTTILVGPVGCGKTAAVYAVASELDCKVLEINASSKRTGKRVLSEFLEATQSHQVRKSSEQSAAGIKGFFKEDSTTKSRKKHSKEKETVQTHTEDHNCKKLSIILVEDVDLVFEDQDDGFTSALSLLLTSSKRPVILTTSDPSCLHLSKLMQQYCVLQFVPPSARLISVWLQLVSLLEGNRFSNLALQRLFEASGSDMRKTIHNLQFWAQMSGGCVDSKERLRALADSPQLPETSVGTEDDSKLVWASSKNVDEREAEPAPVWDVVLSSSCRSLPLPCSVLGVLWWNVGSLLGVCVPRNQRLPTAGGSAEQNNFFSECCTTENEEIDALKKCNVEIVQDKCGDGVDINEELQPVASDECTEKCSPGDTHNADSRQSPQGSSICLRTQVDSLSRLMDDLSDACFVYSSCLRHDAIDLEPCMRPWEQTVKDSISLKDDDRVCSFSEKNTSDGLCCYLFQESVEQCRVSLARAANKESELHKLDWAEALPPSAEKLRWRAQKHKADDLALAAISLSSQLDRSAVALDYNPLLRAIGRQEKSRLAVNAKRKNRFFHYLKGLGIDTTESVLNLMCSSFEDS